MRLGILSRAIIVVSCLWMAGGTFFIAKNIDDRATATATAFYADCSKIPNEGYDCWAARESVYRAHTDQIQGGLWGFAAGLAAIYLALGLILFGILYGSYRWILRGRKTT